MKIAYYLSGYEGGGSAYSVFALLKHLDRSKFEVHVICNDEGEQYHRVSSVADKVHCLNIGRPSPVQRIRNNKVSRSKIALLSNLGWFIRAVRKLSNVIRKERIEIIHSNGSMLGLIAGFAARKSHIKSVWHQRGLMTSNVSWGFFKGVLAWLPRILTDYFIGISQAVVNSMPQSWQKTAKVIYNGLDFSSIDEQKQTGELYKIAGIPVNKPLVGIVGSIIPIKGHREFIQAAGIVARKNRDVYFPIIGTATDSCNEYVQELKDMAESLGVSDRILWLGKINGFNKYMSDLSILVSATEPPGEGFGLTIIEAMAQSVCVVATKCGASPELIRHNKTGMLVDIGASQQMGEAILRFLSNNEFSASVSKAAMRESRTRFDICSVSQAVEKIYDKLLE